MRRADRHCLQSCPGERKHLHECRVRGSGPGRASRGACPNRVRPDHAKADRQNRVIPLQGPPLSGAGGISIRPAGGPVYGRLEFPRGNRRSGHVRLCHRHKHAASKTPCFRTLIPLQTFLNEAKPRESFTRETPVKPNCFGNRLTYAIHPTFISDRSRQLRACWLFDHSPAPVPYPAPARSTGTSADRA